MKKLEYVLYNYKKESSSTDYVPFISDFIRSRTDDSFTQKNNFDRYGTMEKNYHTISKILLEKTKVDHASLFEYFLTYNYLFDKVLAKQEAGIQKVFSLRVDSNCHSFISNGIISHNTESRMAKLGEELLQDIDKETVTFVDNFDGSLKEPNVLPAKFPNLLVNGSSGIAVGMATNIPPHNLGEISDGIVKAIDNPGISITELMNSIRGPDFPTGGLILGKAGLVSAYTTGKGKIKVRARTSIETKKEREAIIVHEIPYMVNKSTLITEIAEFVKDKVIEGISDLRDESDKSGLRIYIELKKGTSADVVLNQLFKHSKLQVTFGINFLAIVDNKPRTLSLKEMVGEFIKHRKDVITKRTQYDLIKAEERVHILEGLRIALDNIDGAIALIKSSKETKIARDKLMEKYTLTEIQAVAILDMKLQRLTALEQDKIRLELKELLTKIVDYKDILAHEIRVLTIIKNELQELKSSYNDERRTEITNIDDDNLEIEDFIEEQECVVTITHAGYVKRLPVDTYKSQGRGGKGIVATTTKDEDVVEHLFIANTHDSLLVFTNDGTVHWMKVFKIPEGSRQARGKAIVNLLAIDEKTKITSCIPIKEFVADKYLVMVTEKGVVKKTSLEAYSHPRQGGIKAITLDEGDCLVNVLLTDGESQILIATRDGQAVKFHEEDARAIGRTSRGVRGITLKGDDTVIGAVIAKDEKTLLTITENGYGKRTPVSEYRLINRGGSGVINIQCSERNGRVIAVDEVNDEDELMFISKNGIIIRTRAKDISSIGRNTQGVRLMRLDADDKIVATAKIVNEDNPEEMKFTYNPNHPHK
ncbi:DNA gyrase subunit A [Candidatus Woesearchaeota archaeon]|nr:DNA gyrase subunit A [Candidatus Woesearchaeota archaeon]